MDTILMPYETFFKDGFFNRSWMRVFKLLVSAALASANSENDKAQIRINATILE